MIDRVKTIKDLIKSANNDRKDQLARLRNAESEKSLTKDIQMFIIIELWEKMTLQH